MEHDMTHFDFNVPGLMCGCVA